MKVTEKPDTSYLDWPFFDDKHRVLAESVELWAAAHVAQVIEMSEGLDDSCVNLVRELGDAGICRQAVAEDDSPFDVRSLCVIRETLARFSGLADFAFAMQGLGSGPISLFGTTAQKKRFLPGVASGWGAIVSILSVMDKPGLPAGTIKADSPLVPNSSLVRANTT